MGSICRRLFFRSVYHKLARRAADRLAGPLGDDGDFAEAHGEAGAVPKSNIAGMLACLTLHGVEPLSFGVDEGDAGRLGATLHARPVQLQLRSLRGGGWNEMG